MKIKFEYQLGEKAYHPLLCDGENGSARFEVQEVECDKISIHKGGITYRFGSLRVTDKRARISGTFDGFYLFPEEQGIFKSKERAEKELCKVKKSWIKREIQRRKWAIDRNVEDEKDMKSKLRAQSEVLKNEKIILKKDLQRLKEKAEQGLK